MAKLRLLVALCATLGWLTGCGGASEPPAGLVYCSEGDPDSFNPQLTTSGTSIDASAKQLYNRLLRFDPNTETLVPDLATAWQVSDDGLEVRFTLRRGVPFHHTDRFQPSREMNADDVVFSFARVLDVNHPFHGVGGGRYPYFQSAGLTKQIKTVRKLDDHQVVFELNYASASFLSELATDFAVILSAEYGGYLLAEQMPERIDLEPVGTGPFKLSGYQRQHYIRYQRHDQYWAGPVALERLVYDITPHSTSRLIKLIGGDCDVAALPQISELSVIQQQDDLAVDTRPGLNVAYWAFNTQKPPLDNPLVRRALSLAVDQRRILAAVYHNTAVASHGLLPPISWAYDADNALPEYNPEKARLLLQQVGVEQLEITIWAMPVGRIYNPNPIKTAELIQQDLAQIGVNSTIVSYDWAVFVNRLEYAEYDSVLIGWSADTYDPDNFFTPLLSCEALVFGSNRARWCNGEFDALMREARQSNDPQTRLALYRELERILRQELPLFPLAHASRTLGRQRAWQGPMLHTTGGIDFSAVVKEP
ncbi:ABC transporter substrate-binding protein [Ferrimonas balearica]|uniref:ABC transporter substrate-binding protein n=1 Tax=Ferrimonas balearica TaxID=44012 RepID=UPI001C5BA9C6|nr:ABC transporter substrate-binding protein [Ferrimonas balearica]MBW3166233.1 ABC transporter substrate-binding protein [Ferrimonas balearica]MBY6224776.1 ABC transporter substrate-binding protein [Ferrimonas balearica]